MKTQNKQEELKEIEEWIKECDVDGRMHNFEFFDSDIEDLKNCINREINKARLQAQQEEIRFLESIRDTRIKLLIDTGSKHLDGTLYELNERIAKLKGERR